MSEDTHEREFGSVVVDAIGREADSLFGWRAHGHRRGARGVLDARGRSALRVGGPLRRALLRAGALSVALLAVGMAEPEAEPSATGCSNGNIVVGVHASSDRVALAMQLLELSGGEALQAA